MKIVRIQTDKGARYGSVTDDTVRLISGDVFGEFTITDDVVPLDEGKLLPPCEPTNILGAAQNYASFRKDGGQEAAKEPILFFKPLSSVNGHMGKIVLPRMSENVIHEAEVGVVIGKDTRNVSKEEALSHVFGYTCFNDVSAFDLVERDGNVTRCKGFDTSSCFGPCIAQGLDPSRIKVECYVNGERRQSGDTTEMLFDIPTLISYISEFMTLVPGDVIATGSPGGTSTLHAGDTVDVVVEGVGTLRNLVVAA